MNTTEETKEKPIKIQRQVENMKIIRLLEQYFLDNPDIRFCQGLLNLQINEMSSESYLLKDKYNEEPNITRKKIEASYDFKDGITRKKY